MRAQGPAASFNTRQHTIGTSSAQLNASTVRLLKGVLIKNTHNSNKLYVGSDNTVTTSTGFSIDAGQSLELEVQSESLVWLIADAASTTVETLAI